ncbi:MAG: serine/threonine protein kinase [Polyangiaceae bacterium]|nr:serine/threonine protein kinase [Polyangiaceae bacterium]
MADESRGPLSAQPAGAPSVEREAGTWAPGELVAQGRYRVWGLLGEGGMSEVYAAEHVELRQPVALKVLRLELEARAGMLERLRREARTLAKLATHPHVVRVRDAGIADDGRLFLVMDLLEGRTLADELGARGPLPPAEALALVRQLLAALGSAHALGFVHRDVKPANLFLTSGGVLKLLDFGIAKAFAEQSEGEARALTEPGQRLGTPAFMAPEYLIKGEVDPRADLYSAGVVLWQLLTAQRPFPFDDRKLDGMMRLLKAVISEGVPPLEQAGCGHLPAELRALVRRATAPRPDDRYPSAQAFVDDLERVAQLLPVHRPRPAVPARARAPIASDGADAGPTLLSVGQTGPAASLKAPSRAIDAPDALREALAHGPTVPLSPEVPLHDTTIRDVRFSLDVSTPLALDGIDDGPLPATESRPTPPFAAQVSGVYVPARATGPRWWLERLRRILGFKA